MKIYFKELVKDCHTETDMGIEWYLSYSTGLIEEDVDFDMDRFDDRDVGLVDDFFDHDDDDEIDFMDY